MIDREWLRFAFSLLILIVGLQWMGCSGSGDELPRESVSGTVTLDGQPIPDGSIQFFPVTAVATGDAVGGGDRIQNGRFYIDREVGLIPGKYRVSINAPGKRAGDRAKPASPAAGKSAELPKELIPMRYNSKSELTAEIKKGGGNDLTFNLDSK